MPTSIAETVPHPSPSHGRSVHSGGSLKQMVYFAMTGGGPADWMRFEKNVRLIRMCTHVLLFTAGVIAQELLRNWSADAVVLRRLGRH